ncbi:phosphatidylethanolamine-binding protein, partial [Mycena galericulata]
RPDISLARPRRWSRPLPEGILPAYDEALRVIRADAWRVHQEAKKQRLEVARAHEKLVAESAEGAKVLEGEERTSLEAELEKMRAKLKILDVQSEVNLPEVRWSVANAMADLSIPSHRHLVEQRWRKDGDLDLLMERIHQMHVVPDVLPVLHPSLDLHVAARLMPKHFDALMRRNRFQRRLNTFKDVIPGNYLTPQQTRVPPKLYANVFHTDVRLYTMLLVDPDVPDEANRTFTTFLHWLKPNIPLSATHTGRIPLLNTHTRYVPPHPQRGTPYHRYVLLLLPQPPLTGHRYTLNAEALLTAQQTRLTQSLRDHAAAQAAAAAEARLGFDVRAFARQWGLNGALGGGVHMWREVWDKYVGAVYRYELHQPQPVYGRPPRDDPQREAHSAPTRQKYRIGA